MGGQVFCSVLIAVEDMEIVTIDLDITAYGHVCWGNEIHHLVDVLILSSLQEWAFDDTGVLLSGLEDRDCVISKIERDDESSVNILWHLCVESCCVSQDLFVIVYVFEEVNLWFLRKQIIYITQRIYLVAEAIVRRNLNDNSWSWLWLHDTADWEIASKFLGVIILSEFVNTSNFKYSSIGNERLTILNFIAGQISITNELLPRLIYIKCFWQSLSPQVYRKRVSSIVFEMNLPYLYRVIGKEVVPLEL